MKKYWKHCSSVSISVSSALEVYLYTTMRYKLTFYLLYLLTYLLQEIVITELHGRERFHIIFTGGNRASNHSLSRRLTLTSSAHSHPPSPPSTFESWLYATDRQYPTYTIHCVQKNVQNFFWISQGKVVTVYRYMMGKCTSYRCQIFSEIHTPKIIKIG